MIIRIVKMEFMPERVQEFLNLFEDNKSRIAGFEGCESLELLNDISDPTIFFTYSTWKEEKYLHQYRESDLFLSVWTQTKILFSAKPEAWSLNSKYSSHQ
jgi:quinol monooxygenase YgiN